MMSLTTSTGVEIGRNDHEDLREFCCPVCFHLPEKQIWLCKNGHSICCDCCADLIQCPECREFYDHGKTRNRAAEEFLARMAKVSCKNYRFGCKGKILRMNVKEHEKTCKFNIKMDLCKLLGYTDCNHSTNTTNLHTLKKHLQETHKVTNCVNDPTVGHRVILGLSELDKMTQRRGSSLWKNILLLHKGTDGQYYHDYFLWSFRFKNDLLVVASICLYREGTEPSRKYLAEGFLELPSGESTEFHWTMKPIGILELRNWECPGLVQQMTIPVSVLRHYLNQGEGFIEINVRLVELEEVRGLKLKLPRCPIL